MGLSSEVRKPPILQLLANWQFYAECPTVFLGYANISASNQVLACFHQPHHILTMPAILPKLGSRRYEMALVYAGLGEIQEAISWLGQAYSAHDVGLLYLKIDPCLDPPAFGRSI
jgi:hypothetical protein